MANMFSSKIHIDIIKYRWLCYFISIILILPGLLAMGYSMYKTHSPLKVGIDFTGGTMIEYAFEKKLTIDDIGKIRADIESLDIKNPSVQLEPDMKISEKAAKKLDFKPASSVSIKTRFLKSSKELNEADLITQALTKDFGKVQLLQTNAVGPTLGKELFKNSMMALLLAFVGIVVYLAMRFQLDYALIALVSLAHDALFVIGTYALFGVFFGTEVDALFITAVLTVIGFSVHDTIVVYDRIRENSRFLAKKMSFDDIVNASVNQTLARSINTSVTTLLTLLALYFLGGDTTKDFVLAMILGIAIGTYSSIFFASVLLAHVREMNSAKTKKFATAKSR